MCHESISDGIWMFRHLKINMVVGTITRLRQVVETSKSNVDRIARKQRTMNSTVNGMACCSA